MLIAKRSDDGARTSASPNLAGAVCPLCESPVIAKCGRIVVWHFAHRAEAECDPWGDPETDWHRDWKARWPVDSREVIMGGHRSDVLTASGKVIEFQHSTLDPDTAAERERFYVEQTGGMAWVFDMREAHRERRLNVSYGDASSVTFRFTPKRPRMALVGHLPGVEVFYDLGGDRLIWVTRHTVPGVMSWVGRIVWPGDILAWDGESSAVPAPAPPKAEPANDGGDEVWAQLELDGRRSRHVVAACPVCSCRHLVAYRSASADWPRCRVCLGELEWLVAGPKARGAKRAKTARLVPLPSSLEAVRAHRCRPPKPKVLEYRVNRSGDLVDSGGSLVAGYLSRWRCPECSRVSVRNMDTGRWNLKR